MRAAALMMMAIVAGLSQGCGPSTAYGDSIFNYQKLEDDTTIETPEQSQAEIEERSAAIKAMGFEDPDTINTDAKIILHNYARIDRNGIVPRALLQKALLYFHINKSRLRHTDYIGVIDYSRVSTRPRFFIVNMKTGGVWAMHVAHGSGSDPDHDGKPRCFSNEYDSNATSLGPYLTSETYRGKWGLALRLDGLAEMNSNVRGRAIVMHGAPYVREAPAVQGRSWGCPAVSFRNRNRVISLMKEGRLLYAGLSLPSGLATIQGPQCNLGR